MYALKIDPATNDLSITDGIFDLVSGAALVAQRLNWRFQTQRGEWLLDQTMGMDYLGSIMVHNPDLGIIRALFVELLTGTEGVKVIESLTLEFVRGQRWLNVSFRVRTDEGDIITAAAEGENLLAVLSVLVFKALGPFVL